MFNEIVKKELKHKNLVLLTLLVIGSFYTNKQNPLFFHTTAELFSVFVAFSMFDVARNTYRFDRNNYFTFLGIAYGAVAGIDLLHALTIKGIEIFTNEGTNLATQLWLIGRYVESLSILSALMVLKYRKGINFRAMIFLYGCITAVVTLAAFNGKYFPNCYIQGVGVTPFKLFSEYFIAIILALSAVLLVRMKRIEELVIDNYEYMLLAIIATIISEVFIMLFKSPHDFMFVIGHIFKILSFYLMYKALLETNLVKPYYMLEATVRQLNVKTNELKLENQMRGKIEKKLRQQEEVLRAILNSTAEGIIVKNSNKEILYKNAEFMKLFEIDSRLHGDMAPINLINIAERFFHNPQKFISKLESSHEAFYSFIDTIYMKSGRVLEYLCQPLVQNGEGIGKVWIFRDITRRRKEAERFKQLVELMPDAIFVHDGIKLMYVNSTAANLCGTLIPESLIGRHIEDFIHKDYKEIMRHRIRDKLEGNKRNSFIEQKLISISGSEIDVESNTFVFENGETPLLMTVARDIRERKEKEALKRRIEEEEIQLREAIEHDRLKTEFFATISHELKTPLNIILGVIQLLKNLNDNTEGMHTSFDGRTDKYIGMMRQNCYRLLRLINNLIDITRMDSGFMKMNFGNHNIVSIVEDISLSVGTYMESKGVTLIFDTEIEERIISCDPDKIERIMLNLLSNAIKFSKKEAIIEVSIFNKVNTVTISVKDFGVGIPENMQTKIFERFRQVDSVLQRHTEGSGIGLSLVKALVEAHGGGVHVKSQLGQGSEFIIELPTVTVDHSVYEEIAASSTQQNVERISIEFSDIYL